MGLLHEAVVWWVERMEEFIPARWRGQDADAGDALLVRPQGKTATLALLQKGRESTLGEAVPENGLATALSAGRLPAATLLQLPSAAVLEREVTLPLAAERDLDRVLAYEMDRLTPFAAADVYWARAVLSRDRARNQLRLRLSIVPKAPLAGLVAALRQAGREPVALRVARPDGTFGRIALRVADPRQGRSARRAMAAMALACAILALVAAGLPLWRQYSAIDEAEARIEAARPRIAEVEALRRRIAGLSTGADILASEAARVGNPLAAIATLTDILPDDAVLTALAMRQRQITLTGQSADAARLIPRLSADPALAGATFLAPVTRTDRDQRELFSIRVDQRS